MTSVLIEAVVQRAPSRVVLNCRPAKADNKLVFHYALENHEAAAIYAMHAMPCMGAEGDAYANDQHVVVILSPQGNVVLGKFAAPMPPDRQIAVPVLPLAKRLEPGGRLEGIIEIQLPLAETSPYFNDLPLRQYEIIDFDAVIFSIGYWLEGIDGLAAVPVDYAPELFAVVTRKTLLSARRAILRFPAKGLQVFRRTDPFPRALLPG